MIPSIVLNRAIGRSAMFRVCGPYLDMWFDRPKYVAAGASAPASIEKFGLVETHLIMWTRTVTASVQRVVSSRIPMSIPHQLRHRHSDGHRYRLSFLR